MRPHQPIIVYNKKKEFVNNSIIKLYLINTSLLHLVYSGTTHLQALLKHLFKLDIKILFERLYQQTTLEKLKSMRTEKKTFYRL